MNNKNFFLWMALNPFALRSQKRFIKRIAVSEVNFIEGLPFEAGCPVWRSGAVLLGLGAGGYLVKPLAV
jgi:hypothetical protein